MKRSVSEKLFTTTSEKYGEKYQEHVLELYKLYVQSAESISSRRQSANSFYLTVNTAIIGVAGYIISESASYGWAIAWQGY